MILKTAPNVKSRNTTPAPKLKENPVYFMACEGQTEKRYIDELRTSMIGNNQHVVIKFVTRTFSERDLTNPLQLINLIYEEKDSADYKEITIEKIVRIVDDWMREEKIIPDIRIQENAAERILSRMSSMQHFEGDVVRFEDIEQEKVNPLFDDLNVCIKHVLQRYIAEFSIEKFKAYFKNELRKLGYEEGDNVCVICDRDFYEPEIYDAALEQCTESEIGFYPTNPCFEFWILLHFDKFVDDIAIRDKIHKNDFENVPGTDKKERATLIEVKKYLPDYTKTNIQFPELQDKIQNAIINETFFSEDEKELKTELGSRMGILVSELLSLPKNN